MEYIVINPTWDGATVRLYQGNTCRPDEAEPETCGGQFDLIDGAAGLSARLG